MRSSALISASMCQAGSLQPPRQQRHLRGNRQQSRPEQRLHTAVRTHEISFIHTNTHTKEKRCLN